MVYDCFQFFNELDMLYIRMKVLNDVVDRFVVSEATETFSGLKKPLLFEENREMFREFEHKIMYQVVKDTVGDTTHARDTFQKNAVTRALVNCSDEDVILYSDLDEIPNPEKIKEILADFDRTKIYHFAQRMFYVYLNMEEVSGNLLSYAGEFPGVEKKKWIGSKLCSYGLMKEQNLKCGELRFPERKEIGIRVDNGGWHFGYMGGHHETNPTKRISQKVISAAHQEYNRKYIIAHADDLLRDGKDLFGRNAHFVRTEIDETYPLYLQQHQAEWDYLILKPETKEEEERRHLRMARAKKAHEREVAVKRRIKKILHIGG